MYPPLRAFDGCNYVVPFADVPAIGVTDFTMVPKFSGLRISSQHGVPPVNFLFSARFLMLTASCLLHTCHAAGHLHFFHVIISQVNDGLVTGSYFTFCSQKTYVTAGVLHYHPLELSNNDCGPLDF